MLTGRRPWPEELEIIDRTMRAISGITDPEELVEAYWNGIGDLLPIGDFVALSRRNVEAPNFLVTRSSRFAEHFNPWTQRDRLPRLSGGLLGEIAYANRPVIIDDVPARLRADDPGHFYLQGFEALIALPQYDAREALHVTILLPPGGPGDRSLGDPDPALAVGALRARDAEPGAAQPAGSGALGPGSGAADGR